MAELPSTVHISTHPCVRAQMSRLRSQSTNAKDTATLIHVIATIVGSEALSHTLQTTQTGTDLTPLNYAYTTETISPTHIVLVPILRSGLSMLSALQTLLPDPVPVHHLGMYREKATLQAVEYYNNLPYHSSSSGNSSSGAADLAIIVDPIIATGSTICAAIETLRDWGVGRILCVVILGAREGLRRAAEVWPEGVEFWVGDVDEGLDERGMIRPGVGDVGDRLFLTVGK